MRSAIRCEVRDGRDYRIHTQHHQMITGGSTFNIKVKSLHMGCFSHKEVETLYQQRTAETGQAFAADIFPFITPQLLLQACLQRIINGGRAHQRKVWNKPLGTPDSVGQWKRIC